MRPLLKIIAFAAACALAAPAAAFADVQLSIHDGRVSLVARDATVRQILAEWARVGQTRIVNGDQVPGGPLTLELTNVTEEQALDIVLRSISGYVAAPRPTPVANASQFDRIIVMPALAPPPSAVPVETAAPSRAVQRPAPFMPGMPTQPPPDDEDEGDQAPVALPRRGPVFNRFPAPQMVAPGEGGVPTGVAPPQGPLVPPPPGGQPAATPNTRYPGMPTGAPAGVPVPGMVVPAPQPQPGQPQPGQPQRPDDRD